MSLPQFAQVLIVGAGPAGVSLALALQKHGCPDIVIVDAALQGQNTSRAAAIHAATVEALETIGVADALVQEGLKFKKTIAWSSAQPFETGYFEPLSKYTKYNYILGVPQHVTERILNKTAQDRGISVHRPCKVVSIKPSADGSKLTNVFFEDGQILRARTVVGADGARSTIRHLANVGWADPSGEVNTNKKEDMLANMIVADITVSHPPPFPAESLNLVLSPDNAGLWVPLPGTSYAEIPQGEPVFRLAIGIPQERGQPPSTPDNAYIQDVLDNWGPNKVLPPGTPRVEVTRTIWSSRFRTHSSVADRFFTHAPAEGGEEGGPIMLVGDAAHIHPPIGGQGMNLGIRDAIKLAPAIAAFVSAATSSPDTASEELEKPLAEWAAERREKALTVIGLVKSMQGLMSMPNERQYALGFIPYNAAWIRDTLMGLALKFEFMKANGAYRVSGLGNP